MSIKKKFTLILISLMSTVLLFSYTFFYILFSTTMVKEVMSYQQSVASLNKNLLTSFMDSIEQTSLMLISNQTMGHYLSTDSTDPLTQIQARRKILDQFSQYSTSQIPNNLNYYYKNTLFLNDRLPIAPTFESKTLDTNSYNRSYNVFSNTQIKNTVWYLTTLKSPQNNHVFINEDSNEFCFAKKIQSTFYVGPYDPDGVGVMVISIKLDQLENILTFSPLTPNSGYCLLSREDKILYSSNESIGLETFLDLYKTTDITTSINHKTNISHVNNEKYVVHKSSLDFGLSVIFVTPYSDILTQSNSFMDTFILFALFVILLMLPLAYLIAHKITKPIVNLSKTIATIDDTRDFDINTLNFAKDKEMIVLCHSFKQLITYVNNLIKDIQDKNEKQKQAELKALQAQINPHFLFNAMDAVNWIALSRNQDDIAHIVGSISNLMRYSITNPDYFTTITDEIANIYEFISIHQLRHDYPIILNIHSTLSLDKLFIPKFIIQPLIENMIKHGIDYSNSSNNLIIQMLIYYENTHLCIEISSNGKVCDPLVLNDYLQYKETSLKPSSGFGIRNVNERIQLHFKDESKLTYLLNDKNQLTAKIILPNLK